jgi:hypothetical protein
MLPRGRPCQASRPGDPSTHRKQSWTGEGHWTEGVNGGFGGSWSSARLSQGCCSSSSSPDRNGIARTRSRPMRNKAPTHGEGRRRSQARLFAWDFLFVAVRRQFASASASLFLLFPSPDNIRGREKGRERQNTTGAIFFFRMALLQIGWSSLDARMGPLFGAVPKCSYQRAARAPVAVLRSPRDEGRDVFRGAGPASGKGTHRHGRTGV